MAGTGDDDIDEKLLVALQRLGRLMSSRQVASDISGAAGVELSQQGVQLLRALHRSGEAPVAALASASQMDIGAVSRQLRLLEDAGLVTRSSSPADRRVVLVDTTDSGARVAARIRDVGLRHLTESLSGWSATDRRRVADLLARLVTDLQRTDIRAADE
ncbi:MarR family winged helix-turn-helix transcriptional regulator [Dermatobacter hominis]|uniref:MarR family winged helix-turn-helix transcriptional regulator n=1 Tax=Dermatobacter hominis TaxID=2884263 RepID=UPI001D121032|nr:MarR family transcriptional regulator [Dermatobacter hominis]UDY34911.1 MarR family transcriptional regulator [Dermatobacter hominis]